MHWKPLQFKQTLGTAQCCSNYTTFSLIWWIGYAFGPAWMAWLTWLISGKVIAAREKGNDRVRKGWLRVFLRFGGINTVIRVFFVYLKDDLLQTEPWTDMWSGICTRLTVDTKYRCVSARFLTVCVMSNLQYLIWTSCRKLNPITGLRLALSTSNWIVCNSLKSCVSSYCIWICVCLFAYG